MKQELKILMLEDNELDAELIKRFLQRAGMSFTARLATGKQEYISAISEQTFDAMLADNSLPQFNSIEALKIMQEKGLDIRFILVTGTVSEEFAAEIIRLGADDYILKNNLNRLPSAINRAIELHEMHQEQKRQAEEIRESNERFNLISKATNDALWEWDLHTRKVWWSESHYTLFGYDPEKIKPGLKQWLQKIHPDDRQQLTRIMRQVKKGRLHNWESELRFCLPDNDYGTLLQRGFVLMDSNERPVRAMGSFLDITDRKLAEEQLRESHEEMRLLASRLQEIREEERAHMAREIHDVLGQQLTGLKMDVSWLSKKLGPREEHIENKLKSISDLLTETIVTVRKLATELRPSILDDVGLAEAMEWQSAEFEKRSGIRVSFRHEGPPISVPVNIS
ncbi:MAG: PAS domain-containing protein, partial [Bacteroidetes bacterium]|nr:PAS domain-containing protein [Bacteroidota bacterium]